MIREAAAMTEEHDRNDHPSPPDGGPEPGRPPLPREGDPPPEDSAGLGALGDGRVLIGFVDEVNGPGAVECAGYRPTIHELRVLAEHWAEQALSVDVFHSTAQRNWPYPASPVLLTCQPSMTGNPFLAGREATRDQ